MMKMEWRVCPQNHNYRISNTGLCKSTHARFEDRFLTPVHTNYADMYVLCEKYGKKKYRAQHLVYTAFVGDVPPGYVVYNKDGNPFNNRLDNLDIMPLADKLFWFAERTKKLPKVNTRKYTFKIDGKTYYTTSSVLKDYPCLGTHQNLSGRAQVWLKGKAPRGKTWSPDGFRIKGVLIWVAKTKTDNKCKMRMDRIQRTYILRRRNETL